MPHDRITVIAALAERNIGLGTQYDRIRTVDAFEPQLTEGLGDDVGIGAHVGRKGQDRIAASLADAADISRGVTVEDRPVLRKGQKPRGVLCGLPVGIVGAALHVVDLLTIQFKGNAKFDQRLDLTLSRQDSASRRGDITQMSGADGGKRNPTRPLHVDDAPPGKVALDGARRLLLDL